MGTPTTSAGDETYSIAGDQAGYDASYHAHPQQQVKDNGPQLRQSRLPLFKHVRSILHKPPPLTTPSHPKWDEHTGELSDSGKPSKVKPSTYVSPYDGAFKFGRRRSPQRPGKARKNDSPVSILNDEDLTPADVVPETQHETTVRSPVSPVSSPSHNDEEDEYEDAVEQSLLPEPLSPNIQRVGQPQQQTTPGSSQIKRKPVSRDFSAENHPPIAVPHSPSQSSDISANLSPSPEPSAEQTTSHFSWTTYATSFHPGRASIDTTVTRQMEDLPEPPRSRFSWSTVATNATQTARAESPPSSPPPLPARYATPPGEPILSRRRPVQRADNEEWSPPASLVPFTNTPRSVVSKGSFTPTSASTVKPLHISKTSTPTSSNSPSTTKALPPPPQLSSENNLTHLETLLAQERDIVLQRRNVERVIAELEKVERASPLDVPFATVRDAKKRLADYRTRLDEVRLEEREIGISISRAHRREDKEFGGEGETLWVRRVTG